ncbi:MAG: hypothetical protein ACQSGP_06450 [Frankia sp.]
MSDPGTLSDFSSVLAAVTGVQVDLRGAASPAGGWLTFGGTGWWTYAPFGSPLFTVGLNGQAQADWASVVSGLDNVADELAAGTLGLMDVRRLWDAEQTVRLHTDHLGAASGRLRTASLLFGSADPSNSGSATGEISAQVNLLASSLSSYYGSLGGPPPVADAIHDAGHSLATFGQGMAGDFRESALHNAASDGVNGIAANMQNYLAQQSVTAETVGQILAGYSTSAGGALPTGMSAFGGDLTQSPVWASANSAVTSRIVAQLDKLDAQARDRASALQGAYQTATATLNAVSGTHRLRRAARSVNPASGTMHQKKTRALPRQEAVPMESRQRLQGKLLTGTEGQQGTAGEPIAGRERLRQDQADRRSAEPLAPVVAADRRSAEPLAPATEAVPDPYLGIEPQQNGEPLTPFGAAVPALPGAEGTWQAPVDPGIEDSVTPEPEGTVTPEAQPWHAMPRARHSVTPAAQ